MVPKVDTFEQDIASEIKRKEASLTGISASSNNVGNDPVPLPKKPPIFLMAIIAFFILSLLGFGFLGYLYFSSTAKQQEEQISPVTPIPKVTSDMHTVSSTLDGQIGRFVTKVEKKDQGYVLTISDYSAVFAYMTRNETSYIDELASLFTGVPRVVATTTQTQIATTTATTTVATSTKKEMSTSTPVGTTTQTIAKELISSSPFYDITISNQNMRVWSSEGRSVVYAFVGTTVVLISNSKEGILALKSGILH